MSTEGSLGADTTTSGADAATLLDRADAMRPLLESHAAEQESLGRLADEVIDAYYEAGFFAAGAPRAVGGLELRPSEMIELVARVSYADAASGWVLMLTSACTALTGAFLDDEAIATMFSGDRPPVVAGQGTRAGRAVPDGDGYRLSGEWSFGSGVKHAGWVQSGGRVEETGEMRLLVVPKSDVHLIDNWDVMGLRATGSIDYTMDDVYVPGAFTYLGESDEPRRGGPFYGIGVVGFAVIGHTGWAIGVGRRMLDEIQAMVAERAGRPGGLAASDAFQIAYADAEAKLRAARALVHEVWAEIEDTLAAGEKLSVRQQTMLRLALAHVTWTAHGVGQFVYQWAGTLALRAGTVQRFFRDLHAGTQHVTSAPPLRAACGRELVGAAPDQVWSSVTLVDRK